jgi:hypothetical protein
MHPATDHSRLFSLIPLALTWTAGLLLTASIGGLWLLLGERWSWAFVLLAGPLALLAVAGVLRQHGRFSARKRLLAALDAYAEREIARTRRRTVPLSAPRFTSSGRFTLPSA